MSDTHSPDAAPDPSMEAGGTDDVASMEDILSSIRSMIAEEATEPVITQYEVTTNIGTEVARARSAVRDHIRAGQGHLHRNDPIPVIPSGAKVDDTLESARARAEQSASRQAEAATPIPMPQPSATVTDLQADAVRAPILEDFDLAAELGAMDPGASDGSALEGHIAETAAPPIDFGSLPEPASSEGDGPDIMDADLVSGDEGDAVDVFDAIDFSAPILTSEPDAMQDSAQESGLGDFDIDALLDLPATAMDTNVMVTDDGLAADALPVNFAQTEDMDLVKSLMAELTDGAAEPADPAVMDTESDFGAVLDVAEPGDDALDDVLGPLVSDSSARDDASLELDDSWLDSELAIPDLDLSEPVSGDIAEDDGPLSVFDEIVDQAISDEEQIDSLARDDDAAREASDILSTSSDFAAGGATVISLADIARRAEADASSLGQEGRPVPSVRTLTDLEAKMADDVGEDTADADADAEVTSEALDPAVADAASLSQEGRPVPPVETLTDLEGRDPDDDAFNDLDLGDMVLDDVDLDTIIDIPDIMPEEAQSIETVSLDTSEADTEPTPETTLEEREALETEIMARNAKLEEIITDEAEDDVSSTFAELNRLVEEKTTFEERGPRIGDLVAEALQPMLKEWLDENLKAIVERAVSKEVKRIASGK